MDTRRSDRRADNLVDDVALVGSASLRIRKTDLIAVAEIGALALSDAGVVHESSVCGVIGHHSDHAAVEAGVLLLHHNRAMFPRDSRIGKLDLIVSLSSKTDFLTLCQNKFDLRFWINNYVNDVDTNFVQKRSKLSAKSQRI